MFEVEILYYTLRELLVDCKVYNLDHKLPFSFVDCLFKFLKMLYLFSFFKPIKIKF